MFSEDLARDIQGAELMITQHSELKAEIDTKEEKYAMVQMFEDVASTLVEPRFLLTQPNSKGNNLRI